MAGAQFKKRGRDDGPKSKTTRPSKKLKKQLAAYHSSSSSDSEGGGGGDDDDTFQAVDLLESDEDDIHNALADDGADSDDGAAASSAGSDGDAHAAAAAAAAARPNKKKTAPAPRPITAKKAATKSKLAKKDAPSEEEGEDGQDSEADDDDDDDDDELDENDEYSDLDDDDDDDQQEDDSNGKAPARSKPKSKSKRADPDAFATSLSKILATKLSAARRADPVLVRSAEAQQAGRRAADAALDAKARKKLRDQKRLALEKGRVRDVLAPTTPGQTTAEILERERRLRKVAQRGVVQLFNAFRTAQAKAAEAERATRKAGVVGMDRKKEKVTEMSKKGFLDLIAAGGGGLKKGPLEEA